MIIWGSGSSQFICMYFVFDIYIFSTYLMSLFILSTKNFAEIFFIRYNMLVHSPNGPNYWFDPTLNFPFAANFTEADYFAAKGYSVSKFQNERNDSKYSILYTLQKFNEHIRISYTIYFRIV
jgi:hypothetical protein